MALNLIKLSVGSETVDDLTRWQSHRLSRQKGRLVHTTYQRPRRSDEILQGGSIYWVIKRLIQVRQRIIGFDEGVKEDGKPCCQIVLDPELVLVKPKPRRPFQGWRYLKPEQTPPDLPASVEAAGSGMPLAMQKELSELGLL